ncbi:hypothetical protein FDC27_06865 [Clostridium botulinum]|nr:hypothetical protein [Clostridium botulinum]NFO66695.1 hypothetical protein [Clostridium botulinum]
MVNDIANMEPRKALFILALTKDEKLDSAICELIANSINAAERLNNSKVLKGYRAELYIGKNNNIPYDFLMKDNCGGISREDAKNKAFKLGNDFKNYKLGFGIGMKRALFKLCEEFILESHTVNDSFKIQMNILDWEKKRGWNIPIKNNNRKTKLEPGVIISVPKLNKDIEKELLSQQFKKKLINKIKLNYETKLEAGFEIYINGKRILCDDMKSNNNVLETGTYVFQGIELKIKIECNSKRSSDCYGWNYVINGDTIINGDKTSLSNWEETVKDSNYNYEKFVGFVYINGDDVSKLPLNTTRDGIDTNNEIYKVIQNRINTAIKNTRKYFISTERSIEYKKPVNEIEDLKRKLNKKSNADVGRETFRRCFENLK